MARSFIQKLKLALLCVINSYTTNLAMYINAGGPWAIGLEPWVSMTITELHGIRSCCLTTGIALCLKWMPAEFAVIDMFVAADALGGLPYMT